MENKYVEPVLHLVGAASITRKEENQDSASLWENQHVRVIVITDGLGGGEYGKYAKDASEFVADCLRDQIKEKMKELAEYSGRRWMEGVFRQAKDKLVAFAEEMVKKDKGDENNLFGTTAIALIETENKIIVAYTGNGAVWHIRGNFDEFPSQFPFPWNAVNLLNPHSIPENGKEALYRLISNSPNDEECIPTIIEINKDQQQGDIVMVCTDGIYSADQQIPGRNAKGIWIRYEPAMLVFFEKLNQYFASHSTYEKASIEHFLDEYLKEIVFGLHDDATIGLLITREATSYQLAKREMKDEKYKDTRL